MASSISELKKTAQEVRENGVSYLRAKEIISLVKEAKLIVAIQLAERASLEIR